LSVAQGDFGLFFGPVFTREVVISPRRTRIYVARSAYPAVLLLLICTAWMVLTGTQIVRDPGDLALFAGMVFQILAPLQLALAVFFSAMLAASAVAQEKDRRTFVLLLLTNLSNHELVLGKLLASLLQVLVMFAAGLPIFMFLSMLGGISLGQIARTGAVTVASILVCGSLGSMLALWREKTFQALALFVLILVLWLALGEAIAADTLGRTLGGLSAHVWAIAVSPWQAISEASRSSSAAIEYSGGLPVVKKMLAWLDSPIYLYLIVATGLAVLLNGLAVLRVRAWNAAGRDEPKQAGEEHGAGQGEHSREQGAATLAAAPHARLPAPGSLPAYRIVWDNPILWREIRTWAYGRKILIVRLTFLVLFGLAAGNLWHIVHSGEEVGLARGALAVLPMLLLSLVLVNAQAVTALTAERDTKALDLLLVSDLTPGEFVFGKLGGIFYNTKEIVILPLLLCGYLGWQGVIGLENLIYLWIGMAVLYVFVAAVGLHAGLIYENSRSAISTSLGTVFFLFVGVATCMRIMVAFSGSFSAQYAPFLAFMVGGGLGLYMALGAKIPSRAIQLASFACPFATFYSITSFLRGDESDMLIVLLVSAAAYGFTTAAILIPAIYEFDETTGRTTE
jgi:ABC-type transport system involved in multi-copper enzyme maturation permease subunit